MMTPNTMRTADPRIVRRIIPTRIPTWQAIHIISNNHIPTKATLIHLPMPRATRDTLASRISWRDLQSASRKPVAKHVTHVVPDCARI
jgi:hypothetical protein